MITDKNGVVILNKPEGLSSFLAVKIVKRCTGVKKAGHMGTLDPLATGVLVVGVNKGTKLFDKYLKSPKQYYVEYEFGYETNTLDREGEIINRNLETNIKLEDVVNASKKFLGKYLQTPPVFSAKKINGKRACDLAREGKVVEVPAKEVELFAVNDITEKQKNVFSMIIDCSSGFYVRSLGRDLAKELSTFATTLCIKRTKCCGFDIASAQSLEEIKEGKGKIIEIEEGTIW